MSTTTSQQFEGSTIEEALAAAVDALGDDLEILDAQKVRRRRTLGVRRKERFEVVAAKRSLAEPKDFEAVLQRMVDRVDEAERHVTAPAAVERDWWQEADFVVPDQQPVLAQASNGRPQPAIPDVEIELDVRREPATAFAASASAPATATVSAGSLTAEAQALVSQVSGGVGAPPIDEPVAPAAMPEPTITVEVDTPEWSRSALLDLDLPTALVDRIRPDNPDRDLDWVAATASAITELLETAEPMSGPCELTGHGAASAVHLIRGACDGFRLDSLIIDDRRVPATPLELSLAIRSLLRDRA